MVKKRSVKVYGQSGYKYRETPTIMLKGQWLKEAGCEGSRSRVYGKGDESLTEVFTKEIRQRKNKIRLNLS